MNKSEKRCGKCKRWRRMKTPRGLRGVQPTDRIGICRSGTLLFYPRQLATTEGYSCDELDAWLVEVGL